MKNVAYMYLKWYLKREMVNCDKNIIKINIINELILKYYYYNFHIYNIWLVFYIDSAPYIVPHAPLTQPMASTWATPHPYHNVKNTGQSNFLFYNVRRRLFCDVRERADDDGVHFSFSFPLQYHIIMPE